FISLKLHCLIQILLSFEAFILYVEPYFKFNIFLLFASLNTTTQVCFDHSTVELVHSILELEGYRDIFEL
ncbi:MAG: hypothetical protein Q8M44_06295, partial [bacterium]|nr:hypothetical protein [bacterium]